MLNLGVLEAGRFAHIFTRVSSYVLQAYSCSVLLVVVGGIRLHVRFGIFKAFQADLGTDRRVRVQQLLLFDELLILHLLELVGSDCLVANRNCLLDDFLPLGAAHTAVKLTAGGNRFRKIVLVTVRDFLLRLVVKVARVIRLRLLLPPTFHLIPNE